MDPGEYEALFRAEDRLWWYRGMAAVSRSMLQRWIPPGADLRILDAGCGTGGAMQTFLAERGTVTGLDNSPLALDFCRQRGLHPLVRGSLAALPFADRSFDLVTSFDVLYAREVPDVRAALLEFRRVLIPGCLLLLRVPAYDWLRGRHDLAVHTARRFTLAGMTALLQESGLDLLHRTHANSFLLPFALARRLGDRLRPHSSGPSDVSLRYGSLDRILGAVLSLEAPLASRWCLPFGLSLYFLALRPE
jgi:SAM-dependent methyltransferase